MNEKRVDSYEGVGSFFSSVTFEKVARKKEL
jgi:hypothetical protein